MSWDRLLRILVMLLALGAYAGGAAAVQPGADGAPGVVFQEGDDGGDEGGEDEGEGEDDELAPLSDGTEVDEDGDTEEEGEDE